MLGLERILPGRGLGLGDPKGGGFGAGLTAVEGEAAFLVSSLLFAWTL